MLNEYEVWANVYYYNSPTLYVDPSSVSKGVGQSFSVDINITGFTAGNWSGGVYGWEFKLGYDGTKLNASTIACNGTGKYLNTGWYYRINWSDTLGLIWYTCTLMGDVQGKTGDGILATVTFNVKAAGSCTLDLHGTKLSGYDYLNKRVYSISHTAVDGSWLSGAVPEFPYGAALEMALAGVIVYVWWRRRRKKPTSISHLPPSALSKA